MFYIAEGSYTNPPKLVRFVVDRHTKTQFSGPRSNDKSRRVSVTAKNWQVFGANSEQVAVFDAQNQTYKDAVLRGEITKYGSEVEDALKKVRMKYSEDNVRRLKLALAALTSEPEKSE
jgi:hypothetical protein